MTITDSPNRAFAREVVARLVNAGFEALWAGGCVRDHLRNVPPNDFDIATSATPTEVRALFGKKRTLAMGEQFGVVVVLGRFRNANQPSVPVQVEVATFRKDAAYEDGRHPTSVQFSTAQEDAARRDFTINGLFFDPRTDRVIDYVNGQRDLQKQLVRAIGDPEDRFDEDKLRMLRAVRFACTLGFQLDSATEAAIVRRSREIHVVSAERIAVELRKTFASPHRSRGLRLLQRCRLLTAILPELCFEQRESSFELACGALASLTNPVGGRRVPQNTRIEPPGLAECLAILAHFAIDDSGKRMESILGAVQRLKLSNQERNLAVWLDANGAKIATAHQQPWPAVQPLLVHPEIGRLLCVVAAIHAAESTGVGPNRRGSIGTGRQDSDVAPQAGAGIAFCRRQLALPPKELNPAVLIDGTALREAGIPPGPIYRTILDSVRDAQLMNQCNTRQGALRLASEIVRMHELEKGDRS